MQKTYEAEVWDGKVLLQKMKIWAMNRATATMMARRRWRVAHKGKHGVTIVIKGR